MFICNNSISRRLFWEFSCFEVTLKGGKAYV